MLLLVGIVLFLNLFLVDLFAVIVMSIEIVLTASRLCNGEDFGFQVFSYDLVDGFVSLVVFVDGLLMDGVWCRFHLLVPMAVVVIVDGLILRGVLDDGLMMLGFLLISMTVVVVVVGLVILFLVFLLMMDLWLYFIPGVEFWHFHSPMFAMVLILHRLVVAHRLVVVDMLVVVDRLVVVQRLEILLVSICIF